MKVENLEILRVLCGQFQPLGVGAEKHEVSFPPDAEDEDTFTAGQLAAFLCAKKIRRIKEKGTDTVFLPKKESNMSILSL